MAVLGLVIERPNQTVGFYARALAERFTRAGFGKTTAYTALRQMAQSKTPRVRCTRKAPGDDRSMDLYEAIPGGHDAFRSWMFRPPSAIPAVRQAIYGRIELARIEDLPQLISTVRQEEHRDGLVRRRERRAAQAPDQEKERERGTQDTSRLRARNPRDVAVCRAAALVLARGAV